jgi:peptidoglycan/LPS O-acetylase OafA/YrhL
VLLNHFAPTASFPGLLIIQQIGWIGVDIFFVISGFLITGILADSKHYPHYYRNFYLRRGLRIFPLYYALLFVLLLWLVVWKEGQHYHEMVQNWGHPGWFFLYAGNIVSAASGTPPLASFIPMWSLHVEEQFYVVFPFLVQRLSKKSLARLLIALVIAAPLLRVLLWLLNPSNRLIQYVLLPARMDGLALGGLIALRLRSGAWELPKAGVAVAGLAMLAAACVGFVLGGRTFDSPFERTAGYSLFSAAIACGILWLLLFRGTWATNWLNSSPLQFVGKISYGVYLLQYPAAEFLGWLSRRLHFASAGKGSASEFLIVCTFSFLLATLSWYGLELHFLRLKDRLAPLWKPGARVISAATSSGA